jgi:hypothetical protein
MKMATGPEELSLLQVKQDPEQIILMGIVMVSAVTI